MIRSKLRLQVAACAAAVALTVLISSAQSPVSGVFFSEGWESGTATQSFNSQFYGTATGTQYRVQNVFTGSGNWAFQHRLTAGMAGGDIQYATQHFGDSLAGPVLATGRGEHFMDLYVQYKIAYSPGFVNPSSFKQFSIGTQDDRRHDNSCCNPWVAHYMTIYAPQPTRTTLLAEANNKQGASGQWVGFAQNANGYSASNPFSIQTGRYYTIEVRRRLNDSGLDNGIFQMWIDGALISEYRNVRYRTPWDGTFGSSFSYGTNFAMISDWSTDPTAQDQSVFYDDVKFSTTYIGAGNALAPPDPPTNVRFVR